MRATALVASLVLSALLLAAAVGRPSSLVWVAWISPLPLFWCIRHCRPNVAASYGAIWGLSFCLLSSAGAAPAALSTGLFLLPLCAVPATYAGLGALMTRAIGFNPLMLACGWILLELALKPAGLHHGLLAAAVLAGDPLAGGVSEGGAAHWLACLLGYVLLASLLAGANASLLTVLSQVRLSIPHRRPLTGLPNAEACPSPQTSSWAQLWVLCPAYPRAPPTMSLHNRKFGRLRADRKSSLHNSVWR